MLARATPGFGVALTYDAKELTFAHALRITRALGIATEFTNRGIPYLAP